MAINLQGGAGKAHKAANVENALPPLRLVIPPTEENKSTEFVTNPLEVAKFYTEPWKRKWLADEPEFDTRMGSGFQKLRTEYLEETVETAKLMDRSTKTICGSFKCFPGATSI